MCALSAAIRKQPPREILATPHPVYQQIRYLLHLAPPPAARLVIFKSSDLGRLIYTFAVPSPTRSLSGAAADRIYLLSKQPPDYQLPALPIVESLFCCSPYKKHTHTR